MAAGPSRIRLHDLPRFYDSGLIASGCNLVTFSYVLAT